MAEKSPPPEAKRPNQIKANPKVRDTMFTLLFAIKANIRLLYFALTGEWIEEKEITIATIKNLFVVDFYNDLAFFIGKEKLVLVESQTNWCPNMPFRMKLYEARMLREWVSREGLVFTGSTPRQIPSMEYYVIFTGEKHTKVRWQYLKTMEAGERSFTTMKVRVFHDAPLDTIVGQYIAFCRVYAERSRGWAKLNDDERLQAVKETIDYCINHGILSDFIKQYRSQVEASMIDIFSEEELQQRALNAKYEEALKVGLEKGHKKGLEEGRRQGREEARQEAEARALVDALTNLIHNGHMEFPQAARLLGLSDEKAEQLNRLMPAH